MQDVARQVHWSSSYLFTGKQPFLSRIPLFSPYLFLPEWPKSIPFPAFGSISKHPTVSLSQPQNVSHSPRQQPPFGWLHAWLIVAGFTPGQRGWCSPGMQPWGAWPGCPFLWTHNGLLPASVRPCSSPLVELGLWRADGSSDGLESSQGGVLFGLSPHCCCVSGLLCRCADGLFLCNLREDARISWALYFHKGRVYFFTESF